MQRFDLLPQTSGQEMSWFKMDNYTDKTPSLFISFYNNLEVWAVLVPNWPFKLTFDFLSNSISLFYILKKGKIIFS